MEIPPFTLFSLFFHSLALYLPVNSPVVAVTSKGANRSQISEGWELSFPIGGTDIPRMQGHPVTSFPFLSFSWLDPEYSPNTKVFREVAQPKIWPESRKGEL